MRFSKKALPFFIVLALGLFMVGCGGSATPQGGDSSETDVAVEQLASVSGYAVHLSEENKEATVEIQIADGESLYQMSRLDTGEAESSTSRNGEWLTTDYFYEGSSAGEMGLDPGTYTVEVSTQDATGTIWIFAFPSDSVDYENMDADQIVDFLLGQIS